MKYIESYTMKREAFTLFELIIVVVIIGVVYSLVFSNFNTKKKVQIFKIANIKEALIPYWKRGNQLDFYLYDGCQKSAIFINDVYQEEIEANIENSEFKKVEIYKADARGEEQKQEFSPIIIDNKLQKVCFKYTLFPNGSNSSYIVKKEPLFYIFYPYFQDVNTTKDLQEAMEMLAHQEFKGVREDEVND